ncbi:MAG: hypothetical protein IJ642_03090 [Oscillospiraceae bacterium]|nr:hypothetical protein [Oscillospiraceae bacterium]
MKNYKQMAEAVLSARDDYLRKKQLAFRYVPVMASFSFAVLIGLHIWQEKEKLPEIQKIPELVTESESAIISPTEAETEKITTAESLPEIIVTESSPESQLTEIPETETNSAPAESMITEQTETSPESEQETEIIPVIIRPETPSPEPEPVQPETSAEILSPETETETRTQIQITVPAEIPEIPETSESSGETQESVIPCEEPEEPDTFQEEAGGISDQTGIVSRIFLHSVLNTDGSTQAAQDTVFCSTGYHVPEALVSDWFDTVDVNLIYPDGSVRLLENIGNAYLVKNTPYGKLAAVRFEGEEVYYLFRSEELDTEEFQKLLSESGIL